MYDSDPLSPDTSGITQDEALAVMRSGRSVFVTGPAGTGKSYIVTRYLESLRRDSINYAVVAPTGIAASHLNGRTLHSFFGIGPKSELTAEEFSDLVKRRKLRETIKGIDVLVIDEISMLSRSVFELADNICRAIRSSKEAFGGIQVVLLGDFYQLPPVERNGVHEPFIYNSKSWNDLKLGTLYLTHQYRQGNDALGDVLGAMRRQEPIAELRAALAPCIGAQPSDDVTPVRLYSHNADVDAINAQELAQLPKPSAFYQMCSNGPDSLVKNLKASCLSPETLELKVGAAVMFVRNEQYGTFVNGTMGTVTKTSEASVEVKLANGKVLTVAPMQWKITDNDGETILASIEQIPLRLAWAITVHKSQGMSLDAVETDLSRAFVEGLGYVALSRAKTIKRLYLTGLNDKALQVSSDAAIIDSELRQHGEACAAQFRRWIESYRKGALQFRMRTTTNTELAQQLARELETLLAA